MNPASVDDVAEEIREAVDNAFDDVELVGTHVTGRAGEFYLTVDDHHYLVTVEPADDNPERTATVHCTACLSHHPAGRPHHCWPNGEPT